MSIATRKDELPLSNFVKREVDSWIDFYSKLYLKKEVKMGLFSVKG